MMLTSSSSISISRNERKEKLTLVGRSRAGDGTCFVIPELKLMFDCGAPIVGWTPSTIFVTHTHSDHISYLTNVLYNNSKSSTIIDLFVPSEAVNLVQKYLRSFLDLVECTTDQMASKEIEPATSRNDNSTLLAVDDENNVQQRFRLLGVSKDEVIQSKYLGQRGLIVKTVRCFHRIVCVGYSICRIRKQLKHEYKELSKESIRQLHLDGINVNDELEEGVILFLGDTTHEVFQVYPTLLLHHNFVSVECSFLDDDSKERAHTTKHMHWDNLKPYVESSPNVLFILSHFSLKYTSLFIRSFFINFNNESKHNNVHPVLLESEIENALNEQRLSHRRSDEKQSAENAVLVKCNCFQCTAS